MNLYFLNGKRQGEQWELVPPGICIGREADNDIQLLMPGVSRYHAKIEFVQAGQWKIIDLNSTNGTKVNGKKIEQPEILQPGAEILIGEQAIRFDEDSRPATPPPPPEPAPKPEPAPIPVPPPKPQPEAAPKNITEKIDLDIFNHDKGKSTTNPEGGGNSPKKRIQNLLFALLLTVLACVAILIFLGMITNQENAGKQRVVVVPRNPFFLEYEKTIVSKDNVFRFSISIAEDESVQFRLNDLKYRRRYYKRVGKVEPELLKSLLSEIRETDFMKIKDDPPGSPADGVDETRVLTIGYDTFLNKVTVRNTYLKRSFEKIENALNQFADSYGLKTISLSQEEMIAEAEQSFKNAQDLFANYQAKPENLREAIRLYEVVIDFLDQFDPKPEKWTISKTKLSEAQELLRKMIKDASFNIQVLYRKREYAAAATECEKLMRIMGPEHKSYQKVHDWKIAFEKELLIKRKKGKH